MQLVRSIFCLFILIFCYPAWADTPVRSITVQGEATTKTPPDMAMITISPQTESKTVKTAKKTNDEKIEKLLATAFRFGIAKTDMQTTYTSVEPVYNYNTPNQPPKLTGYRASASIMFTLRDLNKLAGFMDSVVTEAGIDRLGGIQFGLQDEQGVREQTMLKALQNAGSKAKRMAQTLDVSLGTVIQINEYGNIAPPPVPMPMMMRSVQMESKQAPDLPSGLIEVHQTISVSYELK